MNRVVLITGVAGGVGAATARAFSEDGWHVVGVDRRMPNAPSGCARFVHGDVAESAFVTSVIESVAQHEGRLDALVNNAAIQVSKSFLDMDDGEWDSVMNVNVRTPFMFARAAAPLLLVSRGSMINVSSVHAIATSSAIAAYAASKGALLALTRALAIELAPKGVRVNAVLPGAVDTDMLRQGLNAGPNPAQLGLDDLVQGLGHKHPVGRVGRPDEIAQAILFLADSTKSSFVTGHGLVIDGGATARLSTE